MSERVILVDIDGVLADFNSAFLELLNARRERKGIGPPLSFGTVGMPTVWEWPTAIGFTKDEENVAWNYIRKHPEWWAALEPHSGVGRFLARLEDLARAGAVVPYFVTSRVPATAVTYSQAWLENIGYTRPHVICVNGSKHHIARAVGACAILDDKPANFDSMPQTVTRYLLDRPWNQAVETWQPYLPFVRVHTPMEMLEYREAATA